MKDQLRKILPPSVILWSHKLRGMLAAAIYGNPAQNLKIIGVTGTNGKTTTCNMIAKILEKANYNVGLASTINYKIGDKEWDNKTKMTNVSPFGLQKFLKECVKAGCHWVVLETSSHGIAQYRNYGIDYDVAVLTNVTHDHLDYHKTFEEYRNVKGRMFSSGNSINIINADDMKTAKYFYDLPSRKTYTYGTDQPENGHITKPEILGKKILLEPSSSLVSVVTPIGQVAYELKLPGMFNIYNALAATAVAVALNIHLSVCKQALESIESIPGRMEKVDVGQSFTVLVDYAHTPDALEKIFQTLQMAKRARIISVLGSCGDRDKTKRPILGALAGRFADVVIVTNEDPYTEDASKIIEEVASGVPRGADPKKPKVSGENFFKIYDRKKAIAKAINMAYKDDIVLITGKGAEECMVVGNEKIPWSDRKITKELLLKRING
ncbi:TPA: UDP-N-acetylmuramoyl-L-alanyl-D-glutamate--2,6-diaminopimelate ligase [Candidatus Berkelbacteria bacterium]|uniref:UDP-N-acetylmuramoylalanyl-D-glutamate--2, 6-diaminopimelate ligase, UDP-N-acetylmuramoyl-L-alanyl-D-glutamate--2, 6-diaminopimelate ligase n=1 Tax=Berkelbacteria bacterium GW2011_GWE1_39_12 TaxID=1618337 RepID=A0A0G4B414_9BACT|nr:MAG: UDP-N-acetylmuramoylalanyl-D-glutamate--2,6-diaminopimelate ligase, UDP-N-acetylmuramoyl-L-alanyl-D-glutamate--2,6-diaminopimelate ligase [Berkelbacteria bacterium GW2011_GWE1_39_12]HBO60891.1 UDP-N-acetylmuramoyl-L-alanyl-D-glutamate--2,6-diaminopimelate ligase [Candidatus Berkelbacteria bacterium]